MKNALKGLVFLVLGVVAAYAIGFQVATSAQPCQFAEDGETLLPPVMTPELEAVSTETEEELVAALTNFYANGPAVEGRPAVLVAKLGALKNNTDRFAKAVRVPNGVVFQNAQGNELARVGYIEFQGRWLVNYQMVCEDSPGSGRFKALVLTSGGEEG